MNFHLPVIESPLTIGYTWVTWYWREDDEKPTFNPHPIVTNLPESVGKMALFSADFCANGQYVKSQVVVT
jgi:hypothetical protein